MVRDIFNIFEAGQRYFQYFNNISKFGWKEIKMWPRGDKNILVVSRVKFENFKRGTGITIRTFSTKKFYLTFFQRFFIHQWPFPLDFVHLLKYFYIIQNFAKKSDAFNPLRNAEPNI